MKTITQEIFAVGLWNGFDFTLNDLRKMATSFAALKDVVKVPLKLGHNEEQQVTDGEPALGWVTDVSVNENSRPPKLVAEFSDIPDLVFNAMEKKLYRSVSVELDFDVQHKNSFYDFVLTGVALLGADLPAVNVLNDLTNYLASRGVSTADYTASRHAIYTMGVNNMSEIDDLKKQIEKMKADSSKADLKFAADRKAWEEKEAIRVKAEKDAKFSADRKALADHVEQLIKDKHMLPKQRDVILNDLTEENISARQFTIETIKQGIPDKDLNTKTPAKGSSASSSSDELPDSFFAREIATIQSKAPGMSFTNAKHAAMRANPEMARRYIEMDGMTGTEH